MASMLAQATCGVMMRLGSSAPWSRQHIAVFRRLDGQNVETRAADLAALQGFDQRCLVDKAATRRVDEDRVLLHQFELRRADDVAGAIGQRTMQRDDVAFLEDRVEIDLARKIVDIGCDHFHPEGFGACRHRFAERAIADEPQRRSGDVADRVIEIAELIDRLPFAFADVERIGDEVAAQREDERERMFWHRVHRIIADY